MDTHSIATELLIMFVVAFALFGISVVAKRFKMNVLVVKSSYAGAFFFLMIFLLLFALNIFLGDIYADSTPDERFRLALPGGGIYEYTHQQFLEFRYSRLLAIASFSVAGAAFIMGMLSGFVEPPVDGDDYLALFRY